MSTVVTTPGFTVDPELPTAEKLTLCLTELRPGDVLQFGYTRYVVSYETADGGRLLFDLEGNGNSRELHDGTGVAEFAVQRPVYTVEYRAEHLGVTELVRVECENELSAVQCMGSVVLFDNMTPVAYGSNIDPSRFAR